MQQIAFITAVALTAACEDASVRTDAPATPSDASVVDAPDVAIDARTSITLTVPHQPTTGFDFIVAYQDGDEPWTRAPAPIGDDYVLPILSGRYGVLVACTGEYGGGGQAFRIIQIEHFTIDEAPHVEMDLYGCGDTRLQAPIEGAVTNLGSVPLLEVVTGEFYRTSAIADTYQLSAPVGTRDIVAYSTANTNGVDHVSSMLVHRNAEFGSDASIDLDFSTAAPTTRHNILGVTVGDAERAYTWNYFRTGNGTMARLSSGSLSFYASPAGLRQPGDVDYLQVSHGKYDQTQWRRFERWGGAPGDVTVSMRPPVSGLTCSTTTSLASPRVRATWTPVTADRYLVAIRQSYMEPQLFMEAAMSRAYMGAEASWETPDLTTIAGWPSSYNFTAGSTSICALEVSDANTGPSEFASPHHGDGFIEKIAAMNIFFTP